MTKTELKNIAKEEIMFAIGHAFTKAGDSETHKDITDEMDKQYRRIEKLLGYVPGSWSRG